MLGSRLLFSLRTYSYHARYKNGYSCVIIRTIESARAFLLSRTRGGMDISKLLPSSSACFSFFSKCIALSSSFEALLSSFVALHVAGHIYTCDAPCNTAFYRLPSVYATLICTMELTLSFTVCTCDACTYHGACILLFIIRTHDARTYHGRRILLLTIHARMTLVHTIAYCQCGACSGSPQ